MPWGPHSGTCTITVMTQQTVPLKLSQDTWLKGAEIAAKKKGSETCIHRIETLTHGDTQMLPLGLSMSASHYSVTASRHRVMRYTAESQSAAHWEKDREAETEMLTLCIMFDVIQQIVFHHSRYIMGFPLCLITPWADEDSRQSYNEIFFFRGFD